jgi:hypothetical protein
MELVPQEETGSGAKQQATGKGQNAPGAE